MSRPKREPTPEERELIVRMRSEWSRPLKDVQAALAEQCGNPPSIGLLHRWVGELGADLDRDRSAGDAMSGPHGKAVAGGRAS